MELVVTGAGRGLPFHADPGHSEVVTRRRRFRCGVVMRVNLPGGETHRTEELPNVRDQRDRLLQCGEVLIVGEIGPAPQPIAPFNPLTRRLTGLAGEMRKLGRRFDAFADR
jgi:hypothetical protein